jgi:hypothetical protein
MDSLDNYIDHEFQFIHETRARIGERDHAIERIIHLAIMAANYDSPFASGSTMCLGRLLLDSAVSIEQAFLCAFRAQPKLGWASMRIAAEACKDLDCLMRAPDLLPYWIAIGEAMTPDESRAASSSFSKQRKRIPESAITGICKKTMELCNVLGSHPNATSLASMGPTPFSKEEKFVCLPSRVTDSSALDFHLGHLMTHGKILAQSLAKLRFDTLPKKDQTELSGFVQALNTTMGDSEFG